MEAAKYLLKRVGFQYIGDPGLKRDVGEDKAVA
jgi:hypothetical protein